MKELAHSDPVERSGSLEQALNWGSTRGVTQVTIDSNKPYHKNISAEDAAQPPLAIDAAAYCLQQEIQTLIDEGIRPTPEAIGTRYNSHTAESVGSYGKDFGRFY